jgi:hypothetical protein
MGRAGKKLHNPQPRQPTQAELVDQLKKAAHRVLGGTVKGPDADHTLVWTSYLDDLSEALAALGR